MKKILIAEEGKQRLRTAKCPLHKIAVIVATACHDCPYFENEKDHHVCCGYEDRLIKAAHLSSKFASSFPADGVTPSKTNDVVSNEKKTKIALDTVARDIHEPSPGELAEYFGFTLDDVFPHED